MRYNEIVENIDQSDDDELFGTRLSASLAQRFDFPEDGDLGYALGGGGVEYGNGHQTDGLVIVSRGSSSIAFIPDFTYFDDEPTQEDLEYLFYDDDTERTPLTRQNIDKFFSLSEEADDSDDDLFGKPYKPMSVALDWLNDHDYAELSFTYEFQFGEGANDVEILNDYLKDTARGHEVEVTGIRQNLDNADDPLVSVTTHNITEEQSDDDLFGARKMYYVNIMGNWNTGRYSDYGARRYIVPGSSPQGAITYLKNNEELVYAYIDGQKFTNGKRVVRKPARQHVFLDNSTVFGTAPDGSDSAIERFIRKHRAL